MIILFEDYYLLVCNKPPGLSTEIQNHNYPSIEQLCLQYLQEKFPRRKNYYLRPVHRLDRAASGVVIFAKTYTALQNVNTQILNRKITKKYIAIVEGILNKKEDILKHWLLKDNLQKKVL
ncbi:MAG: RNA pseudouridine synthase [Bacteroidetes bacterium]|nr:RNA pseudouridine synthase [Bacteroidota bacterium]